MTMDWRRLLTTKRYQPAVQTSLFRSNDRSQFQRDYDRLVFSSPFRRLQNKTQVFPLPGSIFVHNRLTHSLEVASVGRSLGVKAANFVREHHKDLSSYGMLDEMGTIVSSACLAHDLGNPPFGHSGEEAISSFFSEGEGRAFQKDVSKEEWADLCHFEGNANAFRLLTHSFNGRRPGGYAMTYTTLASIVKYPYESLNAKMNGFKYGFFQSEKDIYREVAEDLGIVKLPAEHLKYARFPLVYLVEAADDICYEIMDIEDSHKLKILSYDEAESLFLAYYDKDANREELKVIENMFKIVTDKNERIAFLRAGIINKLIDACAEVWIQHYDEIMEGAFQESLIDQLDGSVGSAYKRCVDVAYGKIYNANIVTQIQIAGFKILRTLLREYTEALLNRDSFFSKNLLSLMPEQYVVDKDAPIYEKLQTVVDYVSGMTDSYALNLYRKIEGIELPEIYTA